MGRPEAGVQGWVCLPVLDPQQETRAPTVPGPWPAAAFSWGLVTLDGQCVLLPRNLAPGRRCGPQMPSCRISLLGGDVVLQGG